MKTNSLIGQFGQGCIIGLFALGMVYGVFQLEYPKPSFYGQLTQAEMICSNHFYIYNGIAQYQKGFEVCKAIDNLWEAYSSMKRENSRSDLSKLQSIIN